MRYAISVQYIGKNYSGSQIQIKDGSLTDIPTIQGELEKALCTLILSGNKAKSSTPAQNNNNNIRQIKTVFSGRTDKGVNALNQVVHFDTDETIVASKFLYQINEILPYDISVSSLHEVDKLFHAQKSAKKRHYRFEFINRRCKNAFDGNLMRVKYLINIDRMQKSLNYLLGEHDFSSFKSSGTLNPSKSCTIYETKISKAGGRVTIDIIGNRFLYNMVRTIVGTLLEIEGYNLPSEHMLEVLKAKDRTKAGMTVSPYGLTLMNVMY